MNPLYQTIPAPRVPRNMFNNSHSSKFSMTAQKLYPTLLMECLPGDRHLIFDEMFARVQPLVAPVFQQYGISQHAFFVPMRTLSKNWENFITGGREGTYTSVMPYVTLGNLYRFVRTLWTENQDTDGEGRDDIDPVLCDIIRMYDFIGLPMHYSSATADDSGTANANFVKLWLTANSAYEQSEVPVNLLPFLACQKIWSEYYRDQNVVDDPLELIEQQLGLSTAVGLQVISPTDPSFEDDFTSAWVNLLRMRPRAWKKDRFTSALPFTQRGPDVLLPIAGTAPVVTTAAAFPDTQSHAVLGTPTSTPGGRIVQETLQGSSSPLQRVADFSDADLTTTINDFRRAERLQRWYENSARGGARLNENTMAHWGVKTPDATLDRAVFLGGQYQPLVISEVEQNSQTTSESPQGNLAGKGTSYQSGRLLKHYDSEHGFLIVFTSVLQHGDYYQGIPKVFTRQDRYEYAWPELANLGEEPIFTRELYALAPKDEVFGYTPRYSDYKSMPNTIKGDMATSLRFWSAPRTFDEKPTLSSEFIYNAPIKYPFAVQSECADEFICVVNYTIKSSRLLPFYGVPTI